MRLAVSIVIAAALLASCGTKPPATPGIVVQREIDAIATPCSADPGPAPAFADSDAAIAAVIPGPGRILALSKLYAAGRQQRIEYQGRLEAALAGCAKPPGPSPRPSGGAAGPSAPSAATRISKPP